MRRLRLALLPLAVAVGIAAERASYGSDELAGAAGDLAVGLLLVTCGVIAWGRRPESRIGLLMILAGFTWLVGGFAAALLYLHRGPLVHLHLSYPTGRLPTRLARMVVVLAYVDAAVAALARIDRLTVVLSAVVAATAAQVFLGTSGPARKAGGPALGAALAFAGVLAFGAVARMSGVEDDQAILWTYELVIAAIAIVLLRDLLRGRWAEAVVTGLVVDLGAAHELGSVRDKLARALGDPTLVVGYRLAGGDELVDDAGRPVELPRPGSARAVTPIDDGGERIAVLVHDEGLLADPRLLASVATAARFAVANVRLQAQALARAEELEASRRRIVEAADAQRRRLEHELHEGAERRLGDVAVLLAEAATASPRDADELAAFEAQLVEARAELREFAHGVHPAALTDGGLMPALAVLAARSPIPTELRGAATRLPAPVEAALYFVCSESLANAAKHAGGTRVTVEVETDGDRVSLTVTDDGAGGADASRGSGLRGLADRVEALGGRLWIDSAAGAGTRVTAEVPTSAPAPAGES
ncbi:MAG TPA: ATP-binding protein [Gaiellaceae bacterium]|nr:ATP-binding protein [Gaiellaceae bacterium]